MSSLLLIDGNALLYRAFHAMPDLSGPDKQPTNAVYGFISMMYKAIQDLSPSHLIVCFDAKGPNFRNDLHADYQAHRPPTPDGLISQMVLVREMLDAAGIFRTEQSGFEADDLIGTLSHTYGKEIRVTILTGDKDLLQLVNDTVTVMMLKTGLTKMREYDADAVVEDFGIKPSQIADWKALMGDPSDGYKGVPGVGPKTAVNMITQFHSIENMFAHLDEITNVKLKQLLETHQEQAILCKNLATIRTDVPLDITLENAVFSGYNDKLKDFFQKYRFRTLYKRFFGEDLPEDTTQEKLF